MTKKNILWISSAYVLFIPTFLLIAEICSRNNLCTMYENKFPALLITTFSPLLAVFLFSLITYKLREEVFRSWIRFTYFWLVPWFFFLWLALFASTVTMNDEALSMQFFFGVLYISISSSIIILKYVALSRPLWARILLGILFAAFIPLALFTVLSILP